MSNHVSIEINEKIYEVSKELTLLQALDLLKIEVPRLCYDPRLKSSSSCRLCEVEDLSTHRNVCACATPVREGLKVATHTASLEKFRKHLLTEMSRRYPNSEEADSLSSSFQGYLKKYAVTPDWDRDSSTQLPQPPEFPPYKDFTHPYIRIDMSRCILCYRCVHICQDLQGQDVWKVFNRGARNVVLPQFENSLLESDCVSCGACADTCPSGALEDHSVLAKGKPDQFTITTCSYCGTGCELSVGVNTQSSVPSITQIKPVLGSPVSRGHTCVKGRYSSEFVDSPDRILSPMIRKNGKWNQVTWNEAIEATARALSETKQTFGPDFIGVLGSARATNEESYLAHKFARIAAETNNVDCCARVCHAPSAAGLAAVFGTGAATNSFADIERAGAFLIVGTNTTEAHPILGARIRQQVRKGVELVVIDPRKTELARLATVHLALKPGTNIPMLLTLAHVLIDRNWVDLDFISKRTEGFDEFKKSINEWTPQKGAMVCDVAEADIIRAAEIYGTRNPAMCMHGLGVTEHIQGTDGVKILAYLAMLTGNIGKVGSGVNPLRGQNNVQGTGVMGCEPNKLTGSQKIETSRALHEKIWGTEIPTTVGKTWMQMMDAAAADELKSLLVIGYDVLLSNPKMSDTRRALSKLKDVIVVDLFLNETAKDFGTIFLPVASSFEKDGTFMNGERRIQRVRAAIQPRGDTKTDSEILCLIAEKMGYSRFFQTSDANTLWNEVRSLWPAVNGITYSRLENQGLIWPCPHETHPGTEVLHQDSFPIGPRAHFEPIAFRPSSEKPSQEYPFILITGRSLFYFNANTMTGPSSNELIEPVNQVHIHPLDADRLNIKNRQNLIIKSQHGQFEAPARITDSVRPGELFSTFHAIAARVNEVTGRGRDPVTHTPEYKVTAVSVQF